MLTTADLREIDKVVSKRIKQAVEPLKTDIKTVKTDMSQIRKDIKVIASFFDREYLELRKRVDRIEEHLHLPPLS